MGLTKNVPFTYVKRGVYYFSRRVPSDLERHYSARRIVECLRTSAPAVARSRAMVSAARLDEYWFHLRMTDKDLPGRKLLKLSNHVTNARTPPGASLSLSEALSLYLAGKGKTFRRAAERACGYLIDSTGERQLSEYARSDALQFRDFLVKKRSWQDQVWSGC
jgi:hypothetical protein